MDLQNEYHTLYYVVSACLLDVRMKLLSPANVWSQESQPFFVIQPLKSQCKDHVCIKDLGNIPTKPAVDQYKTFVP